jgi:SAM-dependent methyltransferase
VVARNTEFDPFASTYNRLWGAEYHAQAFPIVQNLLLSRLDPHAPVLDLCCGTGQFTARVQRSGFEVHGIDASESMIGYARLNAPEVAFTVADARSFSLNRKFDAAYSVFESLNHIPDCHGLALAFSCVRRHLNQRAPFLFDLNREDAFLVYWNDTHAIVEPDHVCALRSHYDEAERLAICNVTVFELDDGPCGDIWTRRDFAIRQSCHHLNQVYEALLKADFREVTLYDSRDLGMRGELAHARTFFLAIA